MKIAFLNPFNVDYDPDTPYQRPIGGTESAVAYLSAALAKLGHEVTIITPFSAERVVRNVRVTAARNMPADEMNKLDLAVVVSYGVGSRIQNALNLRIPMVLWCHLASDQPAILPLKEVEEQNAWAGYVMVSKWQRADYHENLHVPLRKCHVIGNAASPAFVENALQPAWFETGSAPSLVYSSTPYRGLDRLLMAFPSILKAVPDVQLKIFSGMGLYGLAPAKDRYSYLYELTRALPGAEYIGPVSQSKLAHAFAEAAALAYPSNYNETSCITVMEAMASGADIWTTGLGALPETLAGHGKTIEPPRLDDKLVNTPMDIDLYINMVVEQLQFARQNPQLAAEQRQKRVDFARTHYNWDRRALEWQALAEQLL